MISTVLARPKFRMIDMTLSDDNEGRNPFGEWLEPLMRARGLNQSALAKAAGLGQSTISSYLSGERTPQTRKLLAQLVAALVPQVADPNYGERLFQQGLRAMVGLDTEEQDEQSRVPRRVVEFYENYPAEVTDPITGIIDNVYSMMDANIIPGKSGREE